MFALEKTSLTRERTRLTSAEVRAAATSKVCCDSDSLLFSSSPKTTKGGFACRMLQIINPKNILGPNGIRTHGLCVLMLQYSTN